jgi:hypothetical protein
MRPSHNAAHVTLAASLRSSRWAWGAVDNNREWRLASGKYDLCFLLPSLLPVIVPVYLLEAVYGSLLACTTLTTILDITTSWSTLINRIH